MVDPRLEASSNQSNESPDSTIPRLTVGAFGLEISVRFEDEGLQPELNRHLPPGWKFASESRPDRTYQITGDGEAGYTIRLSDEPERSFSTQAQLLDFLEGDIQIFVAEFATPHLFIHAGVVAWNGAAILIPGRSFAGKSTLVTSLVKAGATYYSDEYAVLDDQGRVLPYPRRVSLRSGPHGPTGRLDLSHLAPQGPAEDHAISVGLVALLRYDEEGGWDTWELDHLPAIMAMSEQTVAIQRRPADTFAILDKVARNARVIQGTRGDVEETVDRLRRLVTAP